MLLGLQQQALRTRVRINLTLSAAFEKIHVMFVEFVIFALALCRSRRVSVNSKYFYDSQKWTPQIRLMFYHIFFCRCRE